MENIVCVYTYADIQMQLNVNACISVGMHVYVFMYVCMHACPCDNIRSGFMPPNRLQTHAQRLAGQTRDKVGFAVAPASGRVVANGDQSDDSGG